MSLREEILSKEDLPKEELYISEWNTTVYIRSMTGKERDDYEASIIADKEGGIKKQFKNIRARFAVMCCVDAEGNRIFEDGDEERLGQKSAAALDKIFSKAQKLNHLSDDDVEALAGN